MVFLFSRESSGRRPVFRFDSGRTEVTVIIAAAAAERAVIRQADHDSGEGTAAGAPTRTRRRSSRPNPRLNNPPRHVHGELVAVGWPAWLVAIAGEAISGWTPRRADTFEKLDMIGRGTYSRVYKARDLLMGKFVALKKVRFDNLEPETVKFMAREILILRRLDHPNVMKLEGLVTSRMSCSLYLVFECMEHDLAGLSATQSVNFTEPQVKCYMKQLLLGLEHCHEHQVIHRDIKCSNLLIDSEGVLKIADFGLASFFDPNQKLPMTSKVGTLWYRSPELLLGATEYGVGVDLWSAGCVLGELLAGKPILPGQSEVEQLHKIIDLCGCPSEDYFKKTNLPIAPIFKFQRADMCIRETFKDFPPPSLALLETLLAIDPDMRQTATATLISDFFTTEPAACDPCSLPRCPPSKIMDIRLQEDRALRLRRTGKTEAAEVRKVHPRDRAVRAIPAPEANALLQANLDRRRLLAHADAKGKSKQLPPHQDELFVFLQLHQIRQAQVFAPLKMLQFASKIQNRELRCKDLWIPICAKYNKEYIVEDDIRTLYESNKAVCFLGYVGKVYLANTVPPVSCTSSPKTIGI